MKDAVRLVSLLLPTRGRVDKLNETLTSLEETVECAADVEALIKVDDDDVQTLKFLQSDRRKFNVKFIVSPRGKGYADLHLMYNRLCEDAQGRFLFLWNDDALMLTKKWDVQLSRHDDDRLCYVKSRVEDGRGRDQSLFPLVHRSYYETLGHFSMSAHNDTYVYAVLKDFPKVFRETDITIRHNTLQMVNDKTSVEAQRLWPVTKGLWDGEEVQNNLRVDVDKIRVHLTNTK